MIRGLQYQDTCRGKNCEWGSVPEDYNLEAIPEDYNLEASWWTEADTYVKVLKQLSKLGEGICKPKRRETTICK